MSANHEPSLCDRLLAEASSLEARLGAIQLPKLLREAAQALRERASDSLALRCAQLEEENARLRLPSGEAIAMMNRALVDAFSDDPANALRAHTALLPVMRSVTASRTH